MPNKRWSKRGGSHNVKSACLNCRKSKVGCDKARPCARCKKKGIEKTCIDFKHRKRGRKSEAELIREKEELERERANLPEEILKIVSKTNPAPDIDHILAKKKRANKSEPAPKKKKAKTVTTKKTNKSPISKTKRVSRSKKAELTKLEDENPTPVKVAGQDRRTSVPTSDNLEIVDETHVPTEKRRSSLPDLLEAIEHQEQLQLKQQKQQKRQQQLQLQQQQQQLQQQQLQLQQQQLQLHQSSVNERSNSDDLQSNNSHRRNSVVLENAYNGNRRPSYSFLFAPAHFDPNRRMSWPDANLQALAQFETNSRSLNIAVDDMEANRNNSNNNNNNNNNNGVGINLYDMNMNPIQFSNERRNSLNFLDPSHMMGLRSRRNSLSTLDALPLYSGRRDSIPMLPMSMAGIFPGNNNLTTSKNNVKNTTETDSENRELDT